MPAGLFPKWPARSNVMNEPQMKFAALKTIAIAPAIYAVMAAIAGVSMPSFAQDKYPKGPIKIIVPFTPGATDAQLRALIPALTARLGQPVIVVNAPGAGGIVSATQVLKAPADGYTLYFTGSAGLTLLPALRSDVPYTVADFVPIANISTLPGVMVARTDAPYKTFAEMAAYARANPGKINFGSAGVGTASHTFGVGPQAMGGFSFTHIPYKGMADAIQAILGGQIDVGFVIPSVAISHIQAGTLRPLAVTSATRSEFFPGVPTYREGGVNYVDGENYGIVGAKGVPDDVVQIVSAAVADAMKSAEFISLMKKTYTTVKYMGPVEYRAYLQERDKSWRSYLANPRFAELLKQ